MDRPRENSLAWLVLRLSKTIIKNRNRHLAKLGLTGSEADGLQYFNRRPGESISDLKDYYDISHQSARGIVQRLLALELVEQHPCPTDNRKYDVYLTPKGQEVMAPLMYNRERTGQQLLKGMSEEEQAIFVRLLQRAYYNIVDDWGGRDNGGDQ